MLLDFVAGTEVARVERLASSKAFVLAMIKTDAVFAEFPAEIDVLIVDNRGKIEETHVQILDDAACLQEAVERRLQGLRELGMLGAELGQFFVRNDDAAHHHDAGGNRREIVFQSGKLLAAINGFNEKGF